MNIKFYVVFIVILLFAGSLTQVLAFQQWFTSTYKENNIGFWAPGSDSSRNPDVMITNEGYLTVGSSNDKVLTHEDFQKGDIVAKRFCIEESKECVSTFQQDYSNSLPFSFTNYHGVAENDNGDQVEDGDSSIYIELNNDFINKVGTVDDYTSDWFEIGVSRNLNPQRDYIRQLYISQMDNLWPVFDYYEYNNPYTYKPGYSFRSCYYKDDAGRGNIYSQNQSFCSNPNNNIQRVLYVNDSLKHWGSVSVQYRLSVNTHIDQGPYIGERCQDIFPTKLTVRSQNTNYPLISHTEYYSPPRAGTISPSICNDTGLNVSLQARFVVNEHLGKIGKLIDIANSEVGGITIKGNKKIGFKVNAAGIILLR